MNKSLLLVLWLSLLSLIPSSLGSDLDLNPVELFKCWRVFKKLNTKTTPTIPKEFSKKSGDQTLTVPTYTRLHSEQIKKLFDSDSKGSGTTANGLSYRSVDGSLSVLFWPQKATSLNDSVTHRDAVKTILQGELKAIENYLANPKNEKLQMLLDAQENLTYLLGQLKSNSQVPQEITERFFGFKVNAKRAKAHGEMKIESIDFDPIFNGKSSIGSILGWTEEFQKVIHGISDSISPKYRPELYRIEESLLNSEMGPIKLDAPNGSKVIGFSGK